MADNPASKNKPTLASQYEHADSGFDPEIDAPASVGGQGSRKQVDGESASGTPEKQPEKHAHSRTVLRLARDLGIPQAEIDSTPAEDLEDRVYWLNRELTRQRIAANNPAEKPVEKAPEKPAVDEDDLGLGDESDYDPKMLALLKAQQKKLKELEKAKSEHDQKVKAFEEREAARAQQSANDRIDAAFAGLGEDFSGVFGKGKAERMDGNSAEFQRRIAVLRVAETMKQGSLEADLAAAVKVLYPSGATAARTNKAEADHTEEPATPEGDELSPRQKEALKKRQETWRNGGTAKPTHRTEKEEPKGERRAVRAVAELMRTNGMLGDENPPMLSDDK